MDKLNEEMKNLNINNKKELCVYYHEDMLKHRIKEELECEYDNSFPERPLRAKVIYDNLIEKEILNKSDIYTDFDEIENKYISDTHGEKYLNLILELKPKNNEFDFKIDTYYNNHSTRASLLSANSVLLSTQKVLNNEYKNGFAICRPPGHHAHIEGNISGFCFLNNIAIAANYCINYHKYKRVLVLDWDLHHGNSTERLFYENEKVLYISTHEYNNKSFYPMTGDPEKQGRKKGKGYNINIPINVYFKNNKEKYKAYYGNKEFIYTFERIIYPIICEYDPEIIFISNGLDCCAEDPLGDLKLTQDGLCYALSRLKELNKNIVVGLEGGYNLDAIKLASEGLIRVLNGEKMPTKSSVTMYDMDHYYKNLFLNEITKNQLDKLVRNYYSKYWPILLNEKFINLEKKVAKNSLIYRNQVSGHIGSIKYIIDKIHKKSKAGELANYDKIYKNYPELNAFLPKYFGIKDNNIILENLNNNIKTTAIVDLKFGIPKYYENYHDKFIKLVENIKDYNYYISGIIVKNLKGKTCKILTKREIFLEKKVIKHINMLKKMIKTNEVKDTILNFVKNLLAILTKEKIYFLNSSILLLFYKEVKKNRIKLKLIDLNYFNKIDNNSTDMEIKEYENYIDGFKKFIDLLESIDLLN